MTFYEKIKTNFFIGHKILFHISTDGKGDDIVKIGYFS